LREESGLGSIRRHLMVLKVSERTLLSRYQKNVLETQALLPVLLQSVDANLSGTRSDVGMENSRYEKAFWRACWEVLSKL
jgi:hypothetical protein